MDRLRFNAGTIAASWPADVQAHYRKFISVWYKPVQVRLVGGVGMPADLMPWWLSRDNERR